MANADNGNQPGRAAVGLAVILQVHRNLHTLDADEANRLRG